jgi:ribA/ribD-fused uncharacterized protein
MTISSFEDDYRFLSNFWYVPVIYDGKVYASVEHAFQAAKSIEMADREAIRRIKKPGDAKRYGQTIQLGANWESIKRKVMLELLREKFAGILPQHKYLRDKLLATGNQKLIEGNMWHDNYWGVCYCYACNRERNRETPDLGENWLGKLLMHVRQEIQIE